MACVDMTCALRLPVVVCSGLATWRCLGETWCLLALLVADVWVYQLDVLDSDASMLVSCVRFWASAHAGVVGTSNDGQKGLG